MNDEILLKDLERERQERLFLAFLEAEEEKEVRTEESLWDASIMRLKRR